MKKALAVLFVLVLSLGLLAGCGGDPGTTDPGTTDPGTTTEDGATTGGVDSEKVIRISVSGTPVIDPAVGITNSSIAALLNIYDTLVMPEGDDVVGDLAESWESNEEGTEFTFKLKQGVKFHDGDEVKASDVVFSTNRLLTIGEGFAYLYTNIIDSVEAVDDYTVKFTLNAPYGPFVSTLPRLYIVNEDLVMANLNPDGAYGEFGDYGKDWLITNDAGSGPYTVKELVQQSHLYCEKFNDWHGGWEENAPEGFRMIDNTEATTIRTMMASKELEITDMWQSTENLTAMSNLDGVELASYSTMLIQSMYFNTKKAPTDDVNYRKALSCLLDYDMIVNNIFPGSSRAIGPVSSYTAGHVDTTFYNYDLEKAKEYLAKSKYADSYQDMPIEILCNSDVQDLEKIALAFQAAAQQVGISVEISKAPWVTVVERVSSVDSTPHCLSINSGPNFNEAGSTLETRYHSKTTGTYENGEWLQDAELDKQIEDALATVDKDERFAKYAEIQNHIVDDLCPTAWLADLTERVAYQSSYVEWPAIQPNADGSLQSYILGYPYFFADMKIFPDRK